MSAMESMNPYPHTNDFNIPVYSLIPIHPIDRLCFPPEVIAHSFRYYWLLPYPYTWCVYGDYVAMVNCTDLYEYESRHWSSPLSAATNPQLHGVYDDQTHPNGHSEIIDGIMILQDLNLNQTNGISEEAVEPFIYELSDQISDEEAAMIYESRMDRISGLTKKEISDKLSVMKYEGEEGEEADMCVICLMEFRMNDQVGVLRCNHKYHPECIGEWLIRQKFCPLCKGHALEV